MLLASLVIDRVSFERHLC